jgi:hypothetical protein
MIHDSKTLQLLENLREHYRQSWQCVDFNGEKWMQARHRNDYWTAPKLYGMAVDEFDQHLSYLILDGSHFQVKDMPVETAFGMLMVPFIRFPEEDQTISQAPLLATRVPRMPPKKND